MEITIKADVVGIDKADLAMAIAKTVIDFGLVHSKHYGEVAFSYFPEELETAPKTKKATKTPKSSKKSSKTSKKTVEPVEFTGPKGTKTCKKCISEGDALCKGAPQEIYGGKLSGEARKKFPYPCRCEDITVGHNRQFVNAPLGRKNKHARTHKS
jgi:hypothetical protein